MGEKRHDLARQQTCSLCLFCCDHFCDCAARSLLPICRLLCAIEGNSAARKVTKVRATSDVQNDMPADAVGEGFSAETIFL